MEKKTEKPTPKKMGRPIAAEKKSIEVSIEGDYVTIKIPRKDLTKKLLAELI